ncbi:2-hydroxy-acid oxidase [Amylibacter kogurei]|uniref:2-hydroxy-acid oxidase n=1 Tax=Paramylibacter kogurei TaxID=1889778 RepID=A0A2G5KBR5_9RHOB|nr:FAD-binding protein [Amylibacter kogurei]PIB26074.1 2-hydroxy-acid oxidase [Amylibacter kogurei]
MTPKDEQELAQYVKDAGANGRKLRIRGGGTRLALGNAVSYDDMVSMDGFSGVSLYEPGALTLVAGAGTPLREITETLRKSGQQLPFEPMDHCALLSSTGEPTIGGVVACNISGPRRIQAGACRDSLIGVRFVNGQGDVIKNGGRVMKNVTGYDLVKLMAGSFGSLGILTEVAFKVLPIPETQTTITLHEVDLDVAVQAMSSALGSPFDVTGAAHLPALENTPSKTLLRIEGFAKSVKYRADKLAAKLSRFGEVSQSYDDHDIWTDIQNVTRLSGTIDAIWRVSVKPSDAPQFCETLAKNCPNAAVQLDWGGGLIWARVPNDFDLRQCLNVAGHATLIRGDGFAAFQPQPSVLAKVEQNLRQKFDPVGILNTGIMG